MTQITKLLNIAAAEIGVREAPANSNNVKYNTEFYGRAVSGAAYSWCAVFAGWCFDRAGLLSLTPFYKTGDKFRYNALNSAYCPNWVSSAKRLGQWVTEGYLRGDVVLFAWNGSRTANHVGIAESVTDGGRVLITIEGNTSATSDDNGGAVLRRTRTLGNVLGAFRPKYENSEEDGVMETIARKLGVSAEEAAERLVRLLSADGAEPNTTDDNAKAEFAEAVGLGLTDGTNPNGCARRWQVAVMTLRALKKAAKP